MHINFGNSSSAMHMGHTRLGLPASCNACHVSIGDTPATATCGTCHIEQGIALHHDNAGAASCAGCHPGTPAPEDTPVPGFAGLTANLTPCVDNLDNDGDLDYDGNDIDCQQASDPADVDNDGDGVTENQGDCNDADAP
jgi:hypothetical protein